jgi:hypothetical protein
VDGHCPAEKKITNVYHIALHMKNPSGVESLSSIECALAMETKIKINLSTLDTQFAAKHTPPQRKAVFLSLCLRFIVEPDHSIADGAIPDVPDSNAAVLDDVAV